MKTLKLKPSGLDLVDYLTDCGQREIETISPKELEAYEKAEAFPGMPAYSIVRVTLRGEPGVVIYRNDGQVFFASGSELADFDLDDPAFWNFHSAADGETKIVFAEDGVEWGEVGEENATIDHQAVASAYQIDPLYRRGGYATFVGVYRIGKEIPRLLGVTDVAKELGWTKAKVSEYRRRGVLPPPITEIGGRPVWTEKQIRELKKKFEKRC